MRSEPCAEFRSVRPGAPPSVEHRYLKCRCAYAWQLHREAAGGPNREQRLEIDADDEAAHLLETGRGGEPPTTVEDPTLRRRWREHLHRYVAKHRLMGSRMARLIATLTIDEMADEDGQDALVCPLDENASTRSMRVLLVLTDQGERVLICDDHVIDGGLIRPA